MKKSLIVAAAVLISVIAVAKDQNETGFSFPSIRQNGKTAIVAHRGFWKCEAAGNSENSIASLKAAQDAGLWGSECDIHLTKDGVIIVNHNPDIKGKVIADNTYEELSKYLLPNGERRPTLDEYLDQAAKSKKTLLIIELKKQPSQEIEKQLVEKTMEILKAHRMYSPKRVLFISFSQYISEKIAREHPEFINQFLTSSKKADKAPENFAKLGINGIDYQTSVFLKHGEWVEQSHKLGMSVNVWTVNEKEEIDAMIDLGVDAITTNEPILVRERLGRKEFRK